MPRSTLVDIEVQIHHETQPQDPDKGAVLVSLDGDRKAAVWVPKSVAEITRAKVGTVATITLPEDMALEKGLI